jgi:cell division protein FtsZ
MERRLFLQTFNAMGVSVALPATALADNHQSLMATARTVSLIEPTPIVEAQFCRWNYPKIGLIAVGGISRSILGDLAGELPYLRRTIAINTDLHSLQQVKADRRIWLGHGTEPSQDPQSTRLLAQSAMPEIIDAVSGLDMVMLAVGLGGAAGTGVAPFVAQVLREQDILTLGFAVSPFSFEGKRRLENARWGRSELGSHLNALIPVSNSDTEQLVDPGAMLSDVLDLAPMAFIQLARSITNSVARPDVPVSIDFEDLRHFILGQEGVCALGFASASGDLGAEAAVRQAIDHPFLGICRLQKASVALVSIEAPQSALFLLDSKNIVFHVRSHLPPDADIFYSCVSTPAQDGSEFRVSILASGIQQT